MVLRRLGVLQDYLVLSAELITYISQRKEFQKHLPREQPTLHLSPFNPVIPGAPRSLRSLDTRLLHSSIFSLLPLRHWGVRNSRHSWYAIQSRNPRKSVSKSGFLERNNKYRLVGTTTTRKQQNLSIKAEKFRIMVI